MPLAQPSAPNEKPNDKPNHQPHDRLNYGLCGGHRTGKTTLAQHLATALNLPFVRTTTGHVFSQYGLDPAVPMDFATRLFIQDKILQAAAALWQDSPQPFISDRTPIDMMAYTIADVRGDTFVNHGQLMDYYQACIDYTNQFFSHLAIVQPGIPLIHEPHKAALNPSYIEHLNIVVQGLCADSGIKAEIFCLPREVTDLDQRTVMILRQWGG